MHKKTDYEKHILDVLAEAGEEGINVHKLSMHVYNLSCTLFEQPDASFIRKYVQRYLLRKSKQSSSIIESMPQRGYYRLRELSPMSIKQLLIDFYEEEKEDSPKDPVAAKDLSMNLFD